MIHYSAGGGSLLVNTESLCKMYGSMVVHAVLFTEFDSDYLDGNTEETKIKVIVEQKPTCSIMESIKIIMLYEKGVEVYKKEIAKSNTLSMLRDQQR